MLGRLACREPILVMRMAPACSGMSVCMEWTKQMSSTSFAVSGKMSLTHFPHWPYCLKPKGDGMRPFLVLRRVLRSTSLGRWPACLARRGLWSKVSTWEGPPGIKSWMTRLALAGKWGFFGASGFAAFTPTAAERLPCPIMLAKPMLPMPAPILRRASRRVTGFSMAWRYSRRCCSYFMVSSIGFA